jgi:hypothetical protein
VKALVVSNDGIKNVFAGSAPPERESFTDRENGEPLKDAETVSRKSVSLAEYRELPEMLMMVRELSTESASSIASWRSCLESDNIGPILHSLNRL